MTREQLKDSVRGIRLEDGEKVKVIVFTKHGQQYVHDSLIFTFPDPMMVTLTSTESNNSHRIKTRTNVSLKQIEAVSVNIISTHKL